jgi:hypothetical protein
MGGSLCEDQELVVSFKPSTIVIKMEFVWESYVVFMLVGLTVSKVQTVWDWEMSVCVQ